MKTVWKEVSRDHVRGQWAALYVTMNGKGEIVMSRVTWERLGGPKAFHLLFDEPNTRIGLKPTALLSRNAYPASPRGNRGGRVVRAFRLLQEYGLKIPHTIQFTEAEIDRDGILSLDLRSARISNRVKNHFRNRASAQTR